MKYIEEIEPLLKTMKETSDLLAILEKKERKRNESIERIILVIGILLGGGTFGLIANYREWDNGGIVIGILAAVFFAAPLSIPLVLSPSYMF
jgi:hypothetical protein